MIRGINNKRLNRFHRRMILNNYYNSKIKRGKSLYATLFDYFIITAVFFIIMFMLIYSISNRLVVSLLIASLLASFYVSLVYVRNKKMKNKKIAQINDEIAHKQLIKEISKYTNRDFILKIKEMLERYYNTIFHEGGKYIDLIGEINGEIYGVKCFRNSIDTNVSFKDLENFILELETQNVKEGIIVTSSFFSDEVREKVNYILIDFEQLKGIMKEIDQYPTREEIEDYIVSNYNYKKNNMKKVLKDKSKDRVYKFIILGIVLYVFSYFVPYKAYYKVIAFVSLGVGTGLALYNIVRYIERVQKNT